MKPACVQKRKEKKSNCLKHFQVSNSQNLKNEIA